MRLCLASERILHILNYLSRVNDKDYCFPSQNTLLNLLQTHHGIKICRRTLNYALAFLEGNDYIHRVRRIKGAPGEGYIFKTTMYWLKKRGFRVLRGLASSFARTGFKVKKWWLDKKKPAPVSPQEPAEVWTEEELKANRLRLARLFL